MKDVKNAPQLKKYKFKFETPLAYESTAKLLSGFIMAGRPAVQKPAVNNAYGM